MSDHTSAASTVVNAVGASGTGAVIRHEATIAVVAQPDHPLVAAASMGFATDPMTEIRAVVDRGGDVPAFAIARILDEGVQLFVRGGASVSVGGLTLRHDGSNPFVSQMVRVPDNGRVAVRLDDAGPPLAWTQLGDGIVVGGGAEMQITVSASGGVDPTAPINAPVSADNIATPDVAAPNISAAPSPPGGDEPKPPAQLISFEADQAAAPAADVHQAAPDPHAPDHAVQVHGLRCQRGHLVHPSARLCPLCGDNMQNNSVIVNADGTIGVLGPRPPLGVLILPDGRSFQLNRTTVIGRQPDLDDAVRSGEADALLFDEPTVSRAHARIVLEDWNVSLVDLGSANGTAVAASGSAPVRLNPNQPTALQGGTYIYFGSIQIVFQPTSAAPQA